MVIVGGPAIETLGRLSFQTAKLPAHIQSSSGQARASGGIDLLRCGLMSDIRPEAESRPLTPGPKAKEKKWCAGLGHH